MTDEELAEREQERWQELHERPLDDLTDKQITSKIRLSVKRRFSGAWTLMFEFGAQNGRVADAIAVSTAASRNYKIVGFEFKASRADWLRELKDQEKAEQFVRIVDEWYVVAPKGVIEESEIPDGWGYLELKPNSEQLYKIRDSALTDYQQGDPGREFWIKFLKRTVGSESNYSEADVEEARSRGYEQAKTELQTKGHPDVNIDRLRDKADSWDALRDRFEPLPWGRLADEDLDTLELGVKLVKLIDAGQIGGLRNDIESLERNIGRYTESVREQTQTLADGVDALQRRIEEEGKVPDLPDED
jgi:hypothetical protein